MKPPKSCWGLVGRRECLLPTRRGWLLLVAAGLLLATAAVRQVQPFLAVTDAVPRGALVVEGWAPDYALEETIAEFRRHPYSKLYVVGGPLERGAPLSEYKTYADLSAAILIRLGFNRDALQVVPAPAARQDRTYLSALTLKQWLRAQGALPADLTVMSVGAHARRSRLLFAKAFAGAARVGIIAIQNRDYDADRWWQSSQGVRVVTGEILGYGYARLFFHPAAAP